MDNVALKEEQNVNIYREVLVGWPEKATPI
jgi:hypothetical protein